MLDPSELEAENQKIMEEIEEIKRTLNEHDPVDIPSLQAQDFQLQADDPPQVINLKANIVKQLEMRNFLLEDSKTIDRNFQDVLDDRGLDISAYEIIDENLQRTEQNIREIEKSLFYQMAALKYQSEIARSSKIKILLKESYDLLLKDLQNNEELRTKREELAHVRTYPATRNLTPEEEHRFMKELEDMEHQDMDDQDIFSLDNLPRAKINMIADSRLRLLEMKMELSSIDFGRTINHEHLTEQEKYLNDKIHQLQKRENEVETARMNNDVGHLKKFLHTLRKNKLNLKNKQLEYYTEKFNKLLLLKDYYEHKLQTEPKLKQKILAKMKTSVKRLYEMENDMSILTSEFQTIADRLEEENTMLDNSGSPQNASNAVLQQNNEYAQILRNVYRMKYIYLAEIAKICETLQIPPMDPTETPKWMIRRISDRVEELKDIENENGIQKFDAKQVIPILTDRINKFKLAFAPPTEPEQSNTSSTHSLLF